MYLFSIFSHHLFKDLIEAAYNQITVLKTSPKKPSEISILHPLLHILLPGTDPIPPSPGIPGMVAGIIPPIVGTGW